MQHRIARTLLSVASVAVLAGAPSTLDAQGASALPAGLEAAKAALAKYADPIVAIRDGYFSTVGCIDFPTAGGAGQLPYPAGAMGVHFLNMGTVGPQLDSLRPQVLIYEPVGDKLVLAAAEWFMPVEISKTRPEIFGHPFDGPMEGHQPIMPAEMHHWDLHVWLWKENPAGMFTATNAAVKCPAGATYTFHDQAPKALPMP